MSYSFSLNKNQIITLALQTIVVNADTITPSDFTYCSNMLNAMLKFWETENIYLWKRRQGVLFTQNNQYSYQLGSVSGADYCTNSYISTAITTAVSSGATSIVITSVTGMSVNDNIGIQLDNGNLQWLTIGSINIGTNTITFTSGTTSSTAAIGNLVYTFTSYINRPLQIIDSRCYDVLNNTEFYLAPYTHEEYFSLPQKNTPSNIPSGYYYDRLINNALPYTGTYYLFPMSTDITKVIKFTYQDCIQDILNTTDTPDYPQEWELPIIIGLASRIAMRYGKTALLQTLNTDLMQLKLQLKKFNADAGDITIRVSTGKSSV